MNDYCYDGEFDSVCSLLYDIKNILIQIRDDTSKSQQCSYQTSVILSKLYEIKNPIPIFKNEEKKEMSNER